MFKFFLSEREKDDCAFGVTLYQNVIRGVLGASPACTSAVPSNIDLRNFAGGLDRRAPPSYAIFHVLGADP